MMNVLKKWLGGAMIIAMLFGMGIQTASANHDPFGGLPQDKVTVCHATNSVSNPWNSQNVSISSSGAPNGGHDNHDDDIIPPYHYVDGGDVHQSYPGKNWTAENEILWNVGGCDGVVATPTPTPTITPTPTPTPDPTADPEIHGMKFEDTDGDGTKDVGELGLENWTINLYDGAMVLLDSTVTDVDGHYMFDNLAVGTYNVREVQQAGWTQTTANPGAMALVLGDVEMDVDFGNFDNVSISGFKQNQDGMNLAGWTIYIGADSMVTTSSLGYTFEDLGPGTYSVCEVIQSGWQPQSGSLCQDVVVDQSGFDFAGVNFINVQDQEGTQGFWRNALKTKKYSEATLTGWVASIDGSSDWLMPAGYSATNAGMVKLIDDATKQCNKSAGSLTCATLKFSAQYLVTQLDVLAGRKDLDTWYAVTPGAQSLLGLSDMEQLGDIFTATETLVGPLTREQYLTLAGLFDSINNTGY